ncbi:unnamed protein product [Blepharisma stoltei]|uniref:Protein kinase domain-containing protein n=1 Tax=Blepharisma stoltei TaxID=1481888 RepID=A0AAU9JEK4_9CILI|nr:unnamed protein product [Blepharisma stoltei]
MPKINYIMTDEQKESKKWTVWDSYDGKMISREMMRNGMYYDDTINFRAHRICPDLVIKPLTNLGRNLIHFQWWGSNVANFSDEFQNDIYLFQSFMIESLTCMSLLHERGITHGNLSPKKIFSSNGHIKIGYFERGTVYGNRENFFKGSDYMISPQKKAWYNDHKIHINFEKEDVYALGLTFLTCYYPDCDILGLSNYDSEDLKQFVESKTRFLNFSIQTVLRRMLTYDHVQRWPMKEALKYLINNPVCNTTVVANQPASAKIKLITSR